MEVTLERVDIIIAFAPQVIAFPEVRYPLRFKKLGMYAYYQHFLIVGAIEDAYSASLRQYFAAAPQEVVVELFGRGLFKRKDLAPLRVDAGHHMLDGAVLSGRVHCLKYEQNCISVACKQQLLCLSQSQDIFRERLHSLCLVRERTYIPGIVLLQLDLCSRFDPVRRMVENVSNVHQ